MASSRNVRRETNERFSCDVGGFSSATLNHSRRHHVADVVREHWNNGNGMWRSSSAGRTNFFLLSQSKSHEPGKGNNLAVELIARDWVRHSANSAANALTIIQQESNMF